MEETYPPSPSACFATFPIAFDALRGGNGTNRLMIKLTFQGKVGFEDVLASPLGDAYPSVASGRQERGQTTNGLGM